MFRAPPVSTRTATLLPYTTRFRSCSWLLSLLGVEIKQWQDAPRLLIDNDLRAYARHDVLKGLDIDSAARDLRGLAIFRQQCAESGGDRKSTRLNSSH